MEEGPVKTEVHDVKTVVPVCRGPRVKDLCQAFSEMSLPRRRSYSTRILSTPSSHAPPQRLSSLTDVIDPETSMLNSGKPRSLLDFTAPPTYSPGFNRHSLMSNSHNNNNSYTRIDSYMKNDCYTRSEYVPVGSPRRPYVWQGELPPREYMHPVFSCKIFVGGVPWDVTEDGLLEAFSRFGLCRVEWPGQEARFVRAGHPPRGKVTGYVYMIFETEKSVKQLLSQCSQDFGSAGEWYFRLRVTRLNTIETRQVQIIPWVVSDAAYVEDPAARLDAKKTVFVGALHGMITAKVLFEIMNELYGNVVFVGIDTDKFKYPIGSGRVTFSTHASYFRAIDCAFLEIQTSKFRKRVQIDPFLEESKCMACQSMPGPLFCRERSCFRYYCGSCWNKRHVSGTAYEKHSFLTRSSPRMFTSEMPPHSAAYH